MGTRHRLLTPWLAAIAGGVLAAGALGQAPTTEPSPWDLPAEVRSALDEIPDFTVGFDWPGFYAVLRFVKDSPRSPGHTQPTVDVPDWRALSERPNSFRGCPITVEGVVGRNKDPYTLPRYQDLGLITQLELGRGDQPLTCTVIVPEDASDIPTGATIQITGYFVMVRKYPDSTGREQFAAVLVAPGPTSISRIVPGPVAGGRQWPWILGAVVAGLVVAFVLVRRAAGGGRRDVHTLRATQPAPVSLADDLANWADNDTTADDRER